VSSQKAAPERFDPAALAARLLQLAPEPGSRSLLVGYSGGADSAALLAALAVVRDAARDPSRWRLRAIHVNHHLHPEAGQAAQHCRQFARQLGVEFLLRHVRLESGAGRSLEASAREARYASFGRALRRGENLVTAHHLDDQLETVLLQLMRGAGVAGLAAMPACVPFGRGRLLRPLLHTPKRALEHWLAERGLEWREDPTNIELRFDRNFLRREIVPRLQDRWPAAAAVGARSAGHLAEAHALTQEVATQDLRDAAVAARGRRAAGLSIERLSQLSGPRRSAAVRLWLARAGCTAPDTLHLARILGELIVARPDSQPRVAWSGGEVRRYRGHLYASPIGGHHSGNASVLAALQRWHWRRSSELKLAPTVATDLGRLQLRSSASGSLCARCLPAVLTVRGRVGGERLQLHRKGPTRSLKTLLQEHGVLPWRRDAVPLLYAGNTLAAVPGIGVNPAFSADCTDHPRAERRQLIWRRGPAIYACDAAGTSASPDSENLR